MARSYRRRDEPHFYSYLRQSRETLNDLAVLQGLEGALLTRDHLDDASTYVAEFPAGWEQTEEGDDASLEFFVLRGSLTARGEGLDEAGETAPSGGYVHLPQGCGGGDLSTTTGAVALAFWNPNLPAFPPPFTKNRTNSFLDLEWRPSVPGMHSIMHAPLRLPDPMGETYAGGPGGHLRLEYIIPGMNTPFEHNHHACWEELFLLEGDIFIADEGVMAPGTSVSHPQEWWHGPFASARACLFIVHTDAPMDLPWGRRDYPFQVDLCNAYINETEWDQPVEEKTWDELPWKARFQDNPEFQDWLRTKDAEEWGKKVGRNVASSFRASWGRNPAGNNSGGDE